MRHWMSLLEKVYADSNFDLASVPADHLAELHAAGYDTDEVLYHGTQNSFEEFDRKELRTANHFYTAPDIRTAAFYGKTIYACVGKQAPQADLIDDYQLLNKLADELAEDYEDHVEYDEDLQALLKDIAERLLTAAADAGNEQYDQWDAEYDAKRSEEYKTALRQTAKGYLIDIMTSADERLYGMKGTLQNSVMNECFALGYNSVRIYDLNPDGDPISVIFNHATDIVILGRVA